MTYNNIFHRVIVFGALFLSGCNGDTGNEALHSSDQTKTGEAPGIAAQIDDAALVTANGQVANWLTYGRTYSEQRFSPLDQITDKNISKLGLVWAGSLESFRGIEATPIVVDGVMFVTGSWSRVFAFDAKTGERKWSFDPEVPGDKAAHACCDVVNRGVAVYENKVFVGTIDGRLIALDADTGEVVWSTRTTDIEKPYTITGAPRVVKGRVIIGNGGAEYGVRGYVSAYDADTGSLDWRFYTIPGNPADGFENETMQKAAETWTGEWWKYGGGGTVWDSMAYDPDLDLLYIGVGNGSPWNQKVRSPDGGDNLFLSSIVALKPDTGEYVWHYQTTPGETWDFTATQHIMLADMEIDGVTRKVLMQAPKNGFFYVIDRKTGKLISAQNFVPVTWAFHIDLETGRPVENPEARYMDGREVVKPSPFGAHNWHPMSYSPKTGLVYIPAQDVPFLYQDKTDAKLDFETFNTMTDWVVSELPSTEAERKALKSMLKGSLLAWDPVAQKEAWRVQYDRAWNGGTLATAGNLVFQGRADDTFAAYAADSGELLWSMDAGTGIVSGPVSYMVDGEQYVAVTAGWGSVMTLIAGYFSEPKATPVEGRVLVFKLGGDARLDVSDMSVPPVPEPPVQTVSAETIETGKQLYGRYCFMCHGDSVISGGSIPDLRYSGTLGDDFWFDVVLDGALAERGMRSFKSSLNREQAAAVRAYVISRARAAYEDDASR